MGKEYFDIGQFNKAIIQLKKSFHLSNNNKDQFQSTTQLALCYLKIKEIKQASDYFKKRIEYTAEKSHKCNMLWEAGHYFDENVYI